MANVFMANWAQPNCAIRHNSPLVLAQIWSHFINFGPQTSNYIQYVNKFWGPGQRATKKTKTKQKTTPMEMIKILQFFVFLWQNVFLWGFSLKFEWIFGDVTHLVQILPA